jgi:hypothetical protein
MESVSAALMQEPLPVLTLLELVAHCETTPAVPCEPFRDGSAPRLCEFLLEGIHLISRLTEVHCLPLTSSILVFIIFLIPDTFHPRWQTLAFPHCPALKNFDSISNCRNLTLTGKPCVCIC